MGAIKNGLQYAKDGKGASAAKKEKYHIPWNTKERAITGGGIFIGASYINVGQSTIYLQKFDVNDDRNGTLFTHQYMTNVLAPYSEAKSIYNGYQKSGLLDLDLTFLIPVYNNMPEVPTKSPSSNQADFQGDSTKVVCTGSRVNLRTGPSTSYEILTTLEKDTEMTRIEKGNEWSRVRMKNGMVGYLSNQYLAEVQMAQIERIELKLEKDILNKGEQGKVQVKIEPIEVCNRPVQYQSSNPSVATVDNNGKIQAIRSGKTTITVKAVENNVASQIEVTVVTKVTKVEVVPKQMYLHIGETASVQAYVLPEDADQPQIELESKNPEIASISETGEILAKEKGTTTILAKAKENPEIQAETEVFVVRNLAEDEISFADSLQVQNGILTGLEPKENTVAKVKEQITTDLTIEIVDYHGRMLQEDDFVGTGAQVRIRDGEAILQQYVVILYGDADGNGKITSVDLLVIQRHILEMERMDGVFCQASNIRKDGKKPTALDLLFIQRHILEMEKIQQK